MESKENRRKREKHSDGDDYEKSRSKKRRSRSRTPKENEDTSYRRKRRNSRSPNERMNSKKRKNEAPEEVDKPKAPVRKAKETDMLNTRTGGAYIPPARLRMMQAQITDKSSVAYQRLAWEALKKSIHGHINKINVGNIGIIIKELLKENIVRGRGLLCRSVIQAQAASPTFTNVYAALVAAVNSRFPNIGELLLKRLVIQFKRGFKRNDKAVCISSVSFVAHLVNQKVAHEILALEILTLLVESPTDDSVEVAIAFLKECGQKLTEVSSKGVNAIFEMLRNILHEGQLDKRVQYMIEVMFQVWKDGFKDHPAVIEELELVPEEEQFTHLLMLDDATNAQDILNVFKFDEKYEENEQKYKTLSKEILGSDAESGEGDSSGESGSDESEEEDEEEKKDVTIIDNTETNLVALRRTIYLTINSSLDFEECAHKLMKMQLKPGQEIELCHMFLDCCAEQRTYEKFYGLLAQRFCNINRIYIGPFEEIFRDSYGTAHRLDTNRLRNVSKFFAHLLFTDSISWEVLECVKLNEEDTTSSSRIYIKILFQELAEYMGLKKLNDRLRDPTLQEAFSGIFPRDNPKNTRFSINFFTSIGLGGLTDELREHLKQMPKNVPPAVTEINLDSDSSSSDSSSSSSSSDDSSSESSASDSEDEKRTEKSKKKSKTNKSKTSPVPENELPANDKDKSERWGHDGFYDTYGQGARRLESNRPERDNRDREFNREKRRYDQSDNDDRNNFRRRQEGRNGGDKRNNEDIRDTYREDDRRNNEDSRDRYREDDRRSNRYEGRDTKRNQDDTQRVRDKRDDRIRNYDESNRDREKHDRAVDPNKNKSKRNEEHRNQKDRFRDEDDNLKTYRGDRRREMNNDERHENQDKRTNRRKEKSPNKEDAIRDKQSDGRRERRQSGDENRHRRDKRGSKDVSEEDEIREKRDRFKRKDNDETQDKNGDRERDYNDYNRDKRDRQSKKHVSDENEISDIRSGHRKDKISSEEKKKDKEKQKYKSNKKYSSDEDDIIDKRKNKNYGSPKSKRKNKKKDKEQESDSGRDSESDTESRSQEKGCKKRSKKGASDLGGR